jgi:hypothetical protein
MTPTDRDRLDPALEVRLREDAATWGGDLPPRLQARLRNLGRAPRRRSLLPAAMAAALACVAGGWLLRRPAPTPPPSALPRFDVAQLEELAMAPLRSELANVVDDGKAMARGMWQQVPRPLRRLLGSG